MPVARRTNAALSLSPLSLSLSLSLSHSLSLSLSLNWEANRVDRTVLNRAHPRPTRRQ